MGEWLHPLTTPLAGVMLSLLVRFTAGWLALAPPIDAIDEPSQVGRGRDS
jgi:hypothetical protein